MEMTIASFDDRPATDVVVVPFWQDKKPVPAAALKDLAASVAPVLDAGDFHAKEGEVLTIYGDQGKRVMLLGLGKKAACKDETVRRAFAAVVKAARAKKCKSLAVLVHDKKKCAPIAEGILLTNYTFDRYKKSSVKEEHPVLLHKIVFVGAGEAELTECKKLGKIAEAVHFVRDLINSNAKDKTPQDLEKVAKGLAKEFSTIKTKILTKKEIEKEKMGLLLAVNSGSHLDPAFIVMEYRGNPSSKEKMAIIGKGITYDTGGLNLKPTGSMETMKCDMSGAATVLGTLRAAASLKLKVNLVGVVVSTENAIGPESYKPGDVYESHAGKTVEITNTDAEGRLVLADALSYTQKHLKPTQMIDLATLTGSIVVALGEEISGLFSNNDTLAHALIKAGDETGECLWRMPLFADYKEALKSPIADMKNAGSRKGGAIFAALFLQEFVHNIPWAHLDIAGTAFLSEPKHYNPTMATGVGVRLLIALLDR